MPVAAPRPGIVLTGHHLDSVFAKTAHGLVRGSRRFHIAAVVDRRSAGSDAGTVLDGEPRGIPVVASVAEALGQPGEPARACIVGVATPGGVLPDDLRADLLAAAHQGLDLVCGLHALLQDDEEIAAAARQGGGSIIDIRRPRRFAELSFFTGRVLSLEIPRVAVLGTDCALGKRTTCTFLRDALEARGVRTGMVYTGQTGWLQGVPHGFILDATPNDFVSGELERAVLDCAADLDPELILIEGQSALLNPSGPCGSELVLSAGVRHVVLQHAPGRACYEGLEEHRCRIPHPERDRELLRLMGAELVRVAQNDEGLDEGGARAARGDLEKRLGLPVVRPLVEGLGRIEDALQELVR